MMHVILYVTELRKEIANTMIPLKKDVRFGNLFLIFCFFICIFVYIDSAPMNSENGARRTANAYKIRNYL